MPVVIRPAALAFDSSGTPFSQEFADVYHSAASGPGQSRHVFLRGNDLPARWARRDLFTVVETGFGIGLNFMATWSAWREDRERCDRLHYVAIEKHPFAHRDLVSLHARYPEFATVSAALCAVWPIGLPGMHRLHFDHGAVSLTVCFGDARDTIPELALAADAFYLDGFAPDRNPDMWGAGLMKALARLAAPGATLASYSTARAVRNALADAGFATEKRPGFGEKREMLAGRFAPRWPIRQRIHHAERAAEKSAIIIGAGLAGASLAERLCARGWSLDLVERHAAPAREGSGMVAGVLQPHVSRDDSILSRFTRAGFLYAREHCKSLPALPRSASGWCGALQLAADAAQELRMAETFSQLRYPQEYAQYRTRADAATLTGQIVEAGGWWFPTASWIQPAEFVRSQLAAAQSHSGATLGLHFGREVTSLRRSGEQWQALDADGSAIAQAAVVILANACDAARLTDLGPAYLQQVRGQLTQLPAPPFPAPQCIVCGNGYVLPASDGYAVVGASYEAGNADPAPCADATAANLVRLERLLPGSGTYVDPSSLRSQVGFRCVAPDRLPLLGAIADLAAARIRARELSGAHLPELPRIPGLFGAFGYASRGLAWCALAAELLASKLEGEPWPLERSLAGAVDPGRFAIHRLRHGALEGT
jgi:tRNA 5-methylaminomethyl-2-thiouridine biosynthesis bifunctional protein